MAFPWIFAANFETGTNGQWDSEQDTGSRLDFPHFTELARWPGSQQAPYRGAYCMRVQMGDANDHTVRETDLNIADAATAYVAFYLYLAPNVAATANDTFNIYEFQQAGGTVEASVGLRITAATGAVEIGIGDGTAPTTFAAATLQSNRWYHVEIEMLVSTGVAGTLQLFLDGVSVVSLTALTNAAAVGSGDLGTQDTLATTTGTILFDDFIMDDLRIFPTRERFPLQVPVTQSGHVFVGPGCVDTAALLSTTAGNILRLFDTDTGNVDDAQGFVAELDLSAHTSIEGPLRFERGCYAQVTGTNPRGQVIVSQGRVRGAPAPVYYTAWGLRHYGRRRTSRANNV